MYFLNVLRAVAFLKLNIMFLKILKINVWVIVMESLNSLHSAIFTYKSLIFLLQR